MRAHPPLYTVVLFATEYRKASVCLLHQSYRSVVASWSRSVGRPFPIPDGGVGADCFSLQIPRDNAIPNRKHFAKVSTRIAKKKRNARSTNPFELSLQISPGINHIECTRQHQPAARNTNKPAQVRGRSVCGPSDSSFIGIVVFCRPPPA